MFKFLFLLCLESVFASTITEDIARIVRGYVEDLTPGEITEKIEPGEFVRTPEERAKEE